MRQMIACFVSTLLLFPAQAFCWGDEGHRVIARIAVRHLTTAAMQRVSELLEVENTPDASADALATASTWADQVAADTGTDNWHYLNLTLQDNRANMAERCPNNDCITARIRLFAEQLKADDPDSDSRFSDEDALRFLVHLVGELHQPLNAISNADLGARCEEFDAGIQETENLHALWDGPLVSGMGEETLLASEMEGELAAATDGQRAEWARGNADDWAWESHRLAVVNVYRRLGIPKQDIAFPTSCEMAPEEIQQFHPAVDDQYMEAMQPIVREQLKKAGLRLARLLNEIFEATRSG